MVENGMGGEGACGVRPVSECARAVLALIGVYSFCPRELAGEYTPAFDTIRVVPADVAMYLSSVCSLGLMRA